MADVNHVMLCPVAVCWLFLLAACGTDQSRLAAVLDRAAVPASGPPVVIPSLDRAVEMDILLTERAVDLLLLSARQPDSMDANAMRMLGYAYYAGRGIEKDGEAAFYWLAKAATAGDYIAQFLLGLMYCLGEDIEADAGLAAHWFTKAAVQGDSDAQRNLAHLYRYGLGVDRDPMQACLWLLRAVQNGAEDAMEELEPLRAVLSPEEIEDARRMLN
jgi:TPR repeat protein